jgi:hypothetical protein
LQLHEKRDVDGNVVVTTSAIRHWGFVGDTKPDMMMAEVEPGLYLGNYQFMCNTSALL